MARFSFAFWLLCFFTYSFIGWIWESGFVSVRSGKWVNRGFLYGPAIPIYGFGALLILLVTEGVQDSLPLIYLMGMAGASALEYVTGDMMERLFHVRYWDYSSKPLNLNGHICLRVSLGWGVFSVLLVRVVHPPIAALLLRVPENWAQGFDLLASCVFSVDLALSMRNALDLRDLLERLAASNEAVAHVGARLEEMTALLTRGSQQARAHVNEAEKRLHAAAEQGGAAIARKKEEGLCALEAKLRARREKKSAFTTRLRERCATAAEELGNRLAQCAEQGERNRLARMIEELRRFEDILLREELEMAARRDRDYRRALSLLKRNPSAMSRRHNREIEEIRALADTDESRTE